MADDTGSTRNAIDEKEALLHQFASALREANDAIEIAQSAVKGAKKSAKVIRNAAKQGGFTLAILDEALKRESQGNAREQEAQEEERVFVFTALGLPIGLSHKTGTLDLEPAKRDERYWGDDGYRAGVQGFERVPPDNMPPEFMQVWCIRHAAGAERLAWALAEKTEVNPELRGPGGGPTREEIARQPEAADDEPAAAADPLLN